MDTAETKTPRRIRHFAYQVVEPQVEEKVGFGETLYLNQPRDFEDEPTLPFGLCQEDKLESTEGLVIEEVELVEETNIIDEVLIRYLR